MTDAAEFCCNPRRTSESSTSIYEERFSKPDFSSVTASVFIRLRSLALFTASTIWSAMVLSTSTSVCRHTRAAAHCSSIRMPACSSPSSSGTASNDSTSSVSVHCLIAASSGAFLTLGKTTAPWPTAKACSVPINLTMAITSLCFTPGAQYSSAAEGGLPGVHKPATHRLAFQCRPTSLTEANKTAFTLD